jgi:rubrerythrin
MAGKVRVEVTDEHGTVALILGPPALDSRQRKALDRAVERMVGHLWAVLGRPHSFRERDMMAGEDGVRRWTCPVCGLTWRHRDPAPAEDPQEALF